MGKPAQDSKVYKTDKIYSEKIKKNGQPPTLAAPTNEEMSKRLSIINEIGTVFKDYKIRDVSFESNIMDGGQIIDIGTRKEMTKKENLMYV